MGGNGLELLIQLAQHKWQMASITAVGTVIGFVLCLALPTRYAATTSMMPPQQTPSAATLLMTQFAGNGSGSLAALAGGGFGLKNPNDIYVGLLQSRPVADAIIGAFDLRTIYHSRDLTDARKELAANTQIRSDKTGFIVVTVKDGSQLRVAPMANMYAEQLRLLTRRIAASEASQRRLFYEEQLKQARESLLEAEISFENVQQSRGLVQLDAQAKAMIEGLATLRAQITNRELEVKWKRSFSTDQNPDLVMAERQLGSLQAKAAELEQQNHASTFSGMGLRDVPGAGLEYLRAEHDLKYRQAMFELLIKQYDAARLDEVKEATIIQIVEPAIAPDHRSSPQRFLVILLATGVGAIIGLLAAILRIRIDSTKSDPVLLHAMRTLRNAVLS
jgi:uncharacterized protein involved in exopolysaccharide biosynthesis